MQFHSELEARETNSSMCHVCASYIYAHKRMVLYSYEMSAITKVEKMIQRFATEILFQTAHFMQSHVVRLIARK